MSSDDVRASIVMRLLLSLSCFSQRTRSIHTNHCALRITSTQEHYQNTINTTEAFEIPNEAAPEKHTAAALLPWEEWMSETPLVAQGGVRLRNHTHAQTQDVQLVWSNADDSGSEWNCNNYTFLTIGPRNKMKEETKSVSITNRSRR